ncbi:MAG: dihydrolipoamide acetyltransferase family protein [Thermoplasmataceae archaeon]
MYSFKLPDIGEGVTEGEIVKWHVAEGDAIRKDQDMVEVMTDKVTVKIPSPVDGKVTKIMYPEGKVVQVGSVLLQVDDGTGTEKIIEEKPEIKTEEKQPEIQPQAAPVVTTASPAVRRMARERGIDLASLHGTGPGGRITLEDLDMAREIPPSTAQKVPERIIEMTPGDQVIEMRGLRRIIFDKMTKSKQIMPHFTVMEQVDVSPLLGARENLKQYGLSVSFTPFFVKAAVAALKRHPYLNAVYNEENRNYTLRKEYNIGIAIDTPDGLTVAVVRDADRKSLVQISSEIQDLAERARKNELKLKEVQGSTFTVTNVGSIGGIMSTPIINYPEVAILGVHRIISSGEAKNMFLSLSCDHRLIDGAEAARFIKDIKDYVENPVVLLSQ